MDIRFGVDVSTATSHDPVAAAQRAEALGFDFVSANDHPCGTRPNHETWTMLTWIAARTSRIRVASRVLGVPYRAPAMVAKMAATLDALSDGRVILGLGGGASDDEFRAFGLRVPTAAEKVRGLDEAVTIMRGLWTEPAFTFPGELFHVASADMEPKPTHVIPIWLGTFGTRALQLTGRIADGWIPSYDMARPDRAREMREIIMASSVDAGRPPDAVECIYNIAVSVYGEREEGVLTGTPNDLAEQLQDFCAIGFSAFNFIPVGERTEQVERLARDVIPAVRGTR